MAHQHIDLHKTILALSGALDLVGIDEIQHGKRVAFIAYSLAKRLEWSSHACQSILYAGLLHDCGVSKVEEHRHLTETLEWSDAEGHCVRGSYYLQACPLLAHFAPTIRYHHTRWEDLLRLDLPESTKIHANLIYLADRIDILQVPYLESERILIANESIVKQVQALSGTLFAPEFVDAFVELAKIEAFWLSMEPDYLEEDLIALGREHQPIPIDFSDLKELARLFSRVVDAKSPFTEDHSQRVAAIARRLAESFGIRGNQLELIEIAGLLHDIGKLRVPESILEKPGKLTPEEYAAIRRHSFDTYRILKRVFYDSKIPTWAGYHHETMQGDGYPFQIDLSELDLEARLITVADIFQALAQNRPYRSRLPQNEIMAILWKQVETGELDRSIVSTLAEQAEEYYRLATE